MNPVNKLPKPMSPNAFFINEEQQILDIKQSIKEALPQKAAKSLESFIKANEKHELRTLKDYIDNRIFSRLNTIIYRLSNEKLTAEESRKLNNEILTLIHPKTFIETLQSALKRTHFKSVYNQTFLNVKGQFPFPTILERYRFDEKYFGLYEHGLIELTHPILAVLKNHGKQMSSHFDLMKQINSAKSSQTFTRIGIGVVAHLVAGPLASIASKQIFKAFSPDYQAVAAESYGKMDETWELVAQRYKSFEEQFATRVSLYYHVLFGGLVVRLQKDLESLGYQIDDLNLHKGNIHVTVRENERERVISWLQGNEKLIEKAIEQKQWSLANELSLKLVDYLNKNKPIAELVTQHKAKEITIKQWVLKIRYNVMALMIDKFLINDQPAKIVNYYTEIFKNLSFSPDDIPLDMDQRVLPTEHHVLKVITTMERDQTLVGQFETFVKHMVECQSNNKEYPKDNYLSLIAAYGYFIGMIDVADWLKEKINYKAIREIYRSFLDKSGLAKDSFLKHLNKRASLEMTQLAVVDRMIKSYKVASRKIFILRPVYMASLIVVLFLTGNGVALASTGYLLPGVDSFYFNHIENHLLHTNLDEVALSKAAERRHYDRARHLILLGANPNIEMGNGETLLTQSIKDKNTAFINFLFKYNIDVNKTSANLTSPLELAVKAGDEKLVKLLIQQKADINYFGQKHDPALVIAIQNGNQAIIDLLLTHKANVNLASVDGHTALQTAVIKEDADLVNRLLELGAKITPDSKRHNALLTGIDHFGKTLDNPILKVLIQHTESKDPALLTLLSEAVNQSNVSMIQLLIDKGVDVNKASRQSMNDGHGPLLVAAIQAGNMDVVDLLLNHGADVNLASESGNSPLQVAIAMNNISLVKRLLDLGADPFPENTQHSAFLAAKDMTDSKTREETINLLISKMTDEKVKEVGLLSYAIEQKDATLVTLLINRGVDVNVVEGDSDSPLDMAIQSGDLSIVELLLKAGANPDESTTKRPMEVAIEKNDGKLLSLLLKYDADVDFRNDEDLSPLEITEKNKQYDLYAILLKNTNPSPEDLYYKLEDAVNNNDVELGKVLLDLGADPNYNSSDYGSVLLAAVQSENVDFAQLLLKYGADPNDSGTDDNLLTIAQDKGNDQLVALLKKYGAVSAEDMFLQSLAGYYSNSSETNFIVIEKGPGSNYVLKTYNEGKYKTSYPISYNGSGNDPQIKVDGELQDIALSPYYSDEFSLFNEGYEKVDKSTFDQLLSNEKAKQASLAILQGYWMNTKKVYETNFIYKIITKGDELYTISDGVASHYTKDAYFNTITYKDGWVSFDGTKIKVVDKNHFKYLDSYSGTTYTFVRITESDFQDDLYRKTY